MDPSTKHRLTDLIDTLNDEDIASSSDEFQSADEADDDADDEFLTAKKPLPFQDVIGANDFVPAPDSDDEIVGDGANPSIDRTSSLRDDKFSEYFMRSANLSAEDDELLIERDKAEEFAERVRRQHDESFQSLTPHAAAADSLGPERVVNGYSCQSSASSQSQNVHATDMSGASSRPISDYPDGATLTDHAASGSESSSRRFGAQKSTLADKLKQEETETDEFLSRSSKVEHREGRIQDLIDERKRQEQVLLEAQAEYGDEKLCDLFNDATQLKRTGNDFFQSGKYSDASFQYSTALDLVAVKSCSKGDEEAAKQLRAVLYANRGACSMKLQASFEDVVADCSMAVEHNPTYVKALVRRAEANERLDRLDEAMADHKRVLEVDPGMHASRAACIRLAPVIEERNEKLKTEMFSKLKDLGNMCLRPFGLSTENFKMVQDPATGGYNINFSNNPNGGGDGEPN